MFSKLKKLFLFLLREDLLFWMNSLLVKEVVKIFSLIPTIILGLNCFGGLKEVKLILQVTGLFVL